MPDVAASTASEAGWAGLRVCGALGLSLSVLFRVGCIVLRVPHRLAHLLSSCSNMFLVCPILCLFQDGCKPPSDLPCVAWEFPESRSFKKPLQ